MASVSELALSLRFHLHIKPPNSQRFWINIFFSILYILVVKWDIVVHPMGHLMGNTWKHIAEKEIFSGNYDFCVS